MVMNLDNFCLKHCIKALLESQGVVIVSAFQDSSHYMSHNREYSMIEYTGLDNLTNVYRGSRFGKFTLDYGLMCVYILFRNFINNGATPFTFRGSVFPKTAAIEEIGSKCEQM